MPIREVLSLILSCAKTLTTRAFVHCCAVFFDIFVPAIYVHGLRRKSRPPKLRPSLETLHPSRRAIKFLGSVSPRLLTVRLRLLPGDAFAMPQLYTASSLERLHRTGSTINVGQRRIRFLRNWTRLRVFSNELSCSLRIFCCFHHMLYVGRYKHKCFCFCSCYRLCHVLFYISD